MTWDEIQRGQRWFDRFGAAFVFLGRIVPTVRSLVSVPAGLLKMSFSRFVFWSTLGTAIWTTLLATAGYQLGQNYQQGDEWISPASNRSEEHTSELQSLIRISYALFCLKKQ